MKDVFECSVFWSLFHERMSYILVWIRSWAYTGTPTHSTRHSCATAGAWYDCRVTITWLGVKSASEACLSPSIHRTERHGLPFIVICLKQKSMITENNIREKEMTRGCEENDKKRKHMNGDINGLQGGRDVYYMGYLDYYYILYHHHNGSWHWWVVFVYIKLVYTYHIPL